MKDFEKNFNYIKKLFINDDNIKKDLYIIEQHIKKLVRSEKLKRIFNI